MPKGKSVYDIYFEAGASMGPYKGALQKVADVWSGVDFSREKFAWETEKRERNLDTLLATTELVATVGGSMEGFEEGSTSLSAKTGVDEPLKIGRGGESWETSSGFEKLWQSPRYQFGEDVVMSGSEVRKYGRDVKEYGKYGVDLPVDMYKSMHEEYREGYERPEGDWYPGKHAKKLAQTIVPGGETGYKDLYSGFGKSLSEVVSDESEVVEEVAADQSIDFDQPFELSVDPKDTAGTVIPTVKDDTPYKYKSGPGAGSKEWFDTKIKQFKQRNQRPEISGPSTGYNEQLERLAREQGWTGSMWEN